MLMVNQLIGFGVGGGGGPPAVSFRTSATDATDRGSGGTYTFSAQDIGTASDDRYVVVGAALQHNSGAPTITGVTIGGVTATVVVSKTQSLVIAALYIANVPTGTTGDVAVTFTNGGNDAFSAGIGVWALSGLASSTASSTASAGQSASSAALSADITVVSGGVGISFSGFYRKNSTATWAGVTERFDTQYDTATFGSGEEVTITGGDTTTAGAPLAVSVDPSGSPDHMAIVSAAWS